jgi:Ca2+-binding EF-hand superfamily protein
MDLNDDGFVDRHELKAWILRSFKNLSEEEAEDRFEDIDEDNDGKVTWKEYIKDTYGMESEDEPVKQHTIDEPHTDEEEKLVADDKEMFQAADVDKNGYLTPEEFVKFHSPEEHPELLPIILKQTLRDKDKNGDGRIDFQEYVGDNAKNHDKEWLLSEKTRFDEFDRDGDGFLNSPEILSWIVPSNE